MSRPVAELLPALEGLLRAASPPVRKIIEREVKRAIGRQKGLLGSSLSEANKAAIRLRVLQRQRKAGWLREPVAPVVVTRAVSNPVPFCDRAEAAREEA